MDRAGREQFWDIMKNLHSNDEESIKEMVKASTWPKYLCRFRPATESGTPAIE
jgi:hypothetical protein